MLGSSGHVTGPRKYCPNNNPGHRCCNDNLNNAPVWTWPKMFLQNVLTLESLWKIISCRATGSALMWGFLLVRWFLGLYAVCRLILVYNHCSKTAFHAALEMRLTQTSCTESRKPYLCQEQMVIFRKPIVCRQISMYSKCRSNLASSPHPHSVLSSAKRSHKLLYLCVSLPFFLFSFVCAVNL